MLELEQPCPKCGGAGFIFSAEWAEWYDRKATETEQFPAGSAPAGPEEWPCPECKEAGKVLSPDGHTVAALVRRMMSEAAADWEVHLEAHREEATIRWASRHEQDMDELRDAIQRKGK